MKINRKLFSFLAIIIILITGYFFTRVLIGSWSNIRAYSFSLNALIIPAVFFLNLSVVISGLLWRGLLQDLSGRKMSMRFAIRTHIYAWLLKYLPSQAGAVLGKLTLSLPLGYNKKQILTSVIYENIYLVMASFAIGLPGLVFLFSNQVSVRMSLLGLIVFVLITAVFIYSSAFSHFVKTVLKVLKKQSDTEMIFLDRSKLSQFFVLFLLPRVTNMIGFVFLIAAFVPVESSMYLGLGVIYVMASIIGMLAIFVPGGIGVREGIMVLLLSSYYPLGVAVMLSLLARLVVTLGDVVLLIFGLMIRRAD